MKCSYCLQPAFCVMSNTTMQRNNRGLPLCERCSEFARVVVQIVAAGEQIVLQMLEPEEEPLPKNAEQLAVAEAMEVFKAQWAASHPEEAAPSASEDSDASPLFF